VKGRERTYFEYFWNVFGGRQESLSIPESDRKAYAEAYSKPGRMRAAWAYFVSWPQLAKEFRATLPDKVDHACAVDRGEKSLGTQLAEQMKLVADKCHSCGAEGHWSLDSGGTTQGND
jgi:hypothetical protein